MSDSEFQLIVLNFNSQVDGVGDAQLKLVFDSKNARLAGQAQGKFTLGIESAFVFNGHVSGHMHSTGFGHVTKVGALSGQVGVDQPPTIAIQSEQFTASFAVDDNFNGTGTFSVGNHSFECKISRSPN